MMDPPLAAARLTMTFVQAGPAHLLREVMNTVGKPGTLGEAKIATAFDRMIPTANAPEPMLAPTV
jgi:hypothetical protein